MTFDGLSIEQLARYLDDYFLIGEKLIWQDADGVLTWSGDVLAYETRAVVVAHRLWPGEWAFFDGISADVAMTVGWFCYRESYLENLETRDRNNRTNNG